VYITENGAAFVDPPTAGTGDDARIHDEQRVNYFRQHLAAVHQALAAGADVRGYFAWSLLDNYEWAWGYTRRFGIVGVNNDTQERVIKDSGWFLRDVARG
jgi:beta-glucosidase